MATKEQLRKDGYLVGPGSTDNNSPFNGSIGFSHLSTIANPNANYLKLYAKSDDKFYKKTSAGVESEVGGGTSGFSGVSGFSGESNISGFSGFSGASATGVSGFSGTAGTSGFSGSGGGGITGLTTNKVPKAASPTSLTDSVIDCGVSGVDVAIAGVDSITFRVRSKSGGGASLSCEANDGTQIFETSSNGIKAGNVQGAIGGIAIGSFSNGAICWGASSIAIGNGTRANGAGGGTGVTVVGSGSDSGAGAPSYVTLIGSNVQTTGTGHIIAIGSGLAHNHASCISLGTSSVGTDNVFTPNTFAAGTTENPMQDVYFGCGAKPSTTNASAPDYYIRGGKGNGTGGGASVTIYAGPAGDAGTTPGKVHLKGTFVTSGVASSSGTTVTGTGTAFLSEFQSGSIDQIHANGQYRTVDTVISDTVLTTTAAFNPVLSGHKLQGIRIALTAAGSVDTPFVGWVGIGLQNQVIDETLAVSGKTLLGSLHATSSADIDGALSLGSFIDQAQQATPSNPASGRNKLYFKSDGNLYKLNSAGSETTIGTGVSGFSGFSGIGFSGSDGVSGFSGFSGIGNREVITQTSHGFAAGEALYLNGAVWTRAKADTAATAEVVGIVERSVDANTFVIVYGGAITGLTGFSAGLTYFLSNAVAGQLSLTEPNVITHVSKPLLVAKAASTGVVINHRGFEIQDSTSGDASYVIAGGIDAPTNAVNIPFFAYEPLRKASSPNAFDEYFESGISNFTALNNATNAWTNGTLTVTAAGTGGSNIRGAYKAVPAGSWTITALVHHAAKEVTNYYQTGVFVSEAFTGSPPETGKLITLGAQDTGQAVYYKRYPDVISNDVANTLATSNRYQRAIYYRIQYVSGSTLTFSISWDGVVYFPVVSESYNAYLPSGPVNFGIFQNMVSAGSSGELFAVCKFIKLTSP